MESNFPIHQKEDLQQLFLTMDVKELESLLDWLRDVIEQRHSESALQQIPLPKGRQVIDTLQTSKTVYRLEGIKCGKKKCKCNDGKLHGPYWYAYNWDGKKLKSIYIGKTLDVEQAEKTIAAARKVKNSKK